MSIMSFSGLPYLKHRWIWKPQYPPVLKRFDMIADSLQALGPLLKIINIFHRRLLLFSFCCHNAPLSSLHFCKITTHKLCLIHVVVQMHLPVIPQLASRGLVKHLVQYLMKPHHHYYHASVNVEDVMLGLTSFVVLSSSPSSLHPSPPPRLSPTDRPPSCCTSLGWTKFTRDKWR